MPFAAGARLLGSLAASRAGAPLLSSPSALSSWLPRERGSAELSASCRHRAGGRRRAAPVLSLPWAHSSGGGSDTRITPVPSSRRVVNTGSPVAGGPDPPSRLAALRGCAKWQIDGALFWEIRSPPCRTPRRNWDPGGAGPRAKCPPRVRFRRAPDRNSAGCSVHKALLANAGSWRGGHSLPICFSNTALNDNSS